MVMMVMLEAKTKEELGNNTEKKKAVSDYDFVTKEENVFVLSAGTFHQAGGQTKKENVPAGCPLPDWLVITLLWLLQEHCCWTQTRLITINERTERK